MSTTGLQNLDSAIQLFNIWLKELDEKLHWQDRRKSLKVLKITLHAIRDHLTVNQSANFSAQLPWIVRGLYYEGWVPSRVPVQERQLEQFYDHIRTNFDMGERLAAPERLVVAVFDLLNDHISPGEIADVRAELPGSIRAIWPSPHREGHRPSPS